MSECSNVAWAAENDEDVEWARGMWVCAYDCAECRVDVAHLPQPTHEPTEDQ